MNLLDLWDAVSCGGICIKRAWGPLLPCSPGFRRRYSVLGSSALASWNFAQRQRGATSASFIDQLLAPSRGWCLPCNSEVARRSTLSFCSSICARFVSRFSCSSCFHLSLSFCLTYHCPQYLALLASSIPQHCSSSLRFLILHPCPR